MSKVNYVSINLPECLVDELKVWKTAFSVSYGKTVSYAEMLRGMLDNLSDTEPGVFAEFERMVENHPELMDKLANYRKDS